MDYRDLFDDFWRKSKWPRILANPADRKRNLEELLGRCDSIADIDDAILSAKSRKESNRQVMVDFFEFLEDHGIDTSDSTLPNKKLYDKTEDRQLQIAKYLHYSRTKEDIISRFDLSDRTLGRDLRALEEGFEFMGLDIQVSYDNKGNRYQCPHTMHPIFLALNLTELYDLTVYLPALLESKRIKDATFEEVVNKVKAQLSEYAFERLFPDEEFGTYDNYYTDDETWTKKGEAAKYLLKSGNEASFEYQGKQYKGRVKMINGDFRIQTEEGEILDVDTGDITFDFEYR